MERTTRRRKKNTIKYNSSSNNPCSSWHSQPAGAHTIIRWLCVSRMSCIYTYHHPPTHRQSTMEWNFHCGQNSVGEISSFGWCCFPPSFGTVLSQTQSFAERRQIRSSVLEQLTNPRLFTHHPNNHHHHLLSLIRSSFATTSRVVLPVLYVCVLFKCIHNSIYLTCKAENERNKVLFKMFTLLKWIRFFVCQANIHTKFAP
jgi:hypothetical protein